MDVNRTHPNETFATRKPPHLPHLRGNQCSPYPPTPANDDEFEVFNASSGLLPFRKRMRRSSRLLQEHELVTASEAALKGPNDAKIPPHQEAILDDSEASDDTNDDSGSWFAKELRNRRIRHGLDDIRHPKGFDKLRSVLNRTRRSPSPDDARYRRYKAAIKTARTEEDVRGIIVHFIVKRERPAEGYYQDFDQMWDAADTAFNTGLDAPRPHISESYRAESYPPLAQQALGRALRPTSGNMSMPHLCIECKPPQGNMLSAVARCAYDGAVMVEAARKVHEYMRQPFTNFDCQTQALTIAFNGTSMEIYANHAVINDSTEYHHAPLLTDKPWFDLSNFKLTHKHLRNAQDWAHLHEQRKRDALIAHEKRLHIELAQHIVDVERESAGRRASNFAITATMPREATEGASEDDVPQIDLAWYPP